MQKEPTADGTDDKGPDSATLPRLRLRVVFPDGTFLGPGKADLLELIGETGSIAAAGRRMKMSYKRAWSLVETLNAMFAAPLVERTRGGEQGGGASLTPLGRDVLAQYRALLEKAAESGGDEMAALANFKSDMSKGK